MISRIPPPSLRRRLRQQLPRILRRTLLGLLGLLALLVVAGLIYLLSLPGVGGARAKATRMMTAHHEATRSLPVPGKLAAAVISTEDEHFYDNVVINVLTGAGRAALAALQTSQDPGGSTIDQQLASELYGREHSVLGTLREIGLGVKLALHYPKRQILAMYLNVSYYGQGYWGVQQAAEGYFGVSPSQLNWPEAALLGGLLQAPTAYDPVHHLALAKRRQQHVLSQLVVNHHLTQAQARAALAAPLPLRRGAG